MTQLTDRRSAFRLDGDVAVVVGATEGIGRATVELLAEHGARVVLVDCVERVHDTARSVHAAGHDVRAAQADVRDPADLDAACQLAVSTFGRLECG